MGWLPAALVYGEDSWSNPRILGFDLHSDFNSSIPALGYLAFAPAGQRALELLLGTGSSLDHSGPLLSLHLQQDLPLDIEIL